MLGRTRAIAVFLLAPFLLAVLNTQAFAVPTMSSEHPSGCHGSEPAPRPEPRSYQCCVMGHDWAMPATAYSSEFPVLPLSQAHLIDSFLPIFDSSQDAGDSSFVSVSPPLTVPLRV